MKYKRSVHTAQTTYLFCTPCATTCYLLILIAQKIKQLYLSHIRTLVSENNARTADGTGFYVLVIKLEKSFEIVDQVFQTLTQPKSKKDRIIFSKSTTEYFNLSVQFRLWRTSGSLFKEELYALAFLKLDRVNYCKPIQILRPQLHA